MCHHNLINFSLIFYDFFPPFSSVWQLRFRTCVWPTAEQRRFIWTGIAHLPAYFCVPGPGLPGNNHIGPVLSGLTVLLYLSPAAAAAAAVVWRGPFWLQLSQHWWFDGYQWRFFQRPWRQAKRRCCKQEPIWFPSSHGRLWTAGSNR